MGRLSGRVAIVTGAGDGIGRGISRAFAREGARVLVADVNEAAARTVCEDIETGIGGEARPLAVDVSTADGNAAMVATALDAWGAVDILVNNAWRGGQLSRLERKPDALFEQSLAIAFFGPLAAMRAVFPGMKARGHGRIINVCSLNGVNAHVGTAEYNSAKEALRSLTRTAALEWAPHGIVANVICPAAKSAATRRVFAAHPELEAAADQANPMGRLGDPENDIAPVAVFLASDDARYLTGNTLFVDGGSHINGAPWQPDLPDD